MEADYYLINGCRSILLRPAGAFCGEGVLQTAGESWALASLLLGQWKITEEARLPSALPQVLPGPGGHRGKSETGKTLLTWGGQESGRRRGRGVAAAAGEGAGTGRCVDSCQSPWSRTSGAHHVSPAEMDPRDHEKTMRQLGAHIGPSHLLPAGPGLGLLLPNHGKKNRHRSGSKRTRL